MCCGSQFGGFSPWSLGLVGFEVAHHGDTMWPNHSLPGQEPKRERARGKGPMVPPPLMSCWATMGIGIQVHINTRTHKDFFF